MIRSNLRGSKQIRENKKILKPKFGFVQVKFFSNVLGKVTQITSIRRVFLFKEKLLILCNACDITINNPLDYSYSRVRIWSIWWR